MYSPKDIKVIVKFETPDGNVFDNLPDALSHKPAPLYRIWCDDAELSETDDLGEAFYVYLPNADAADSFLRDCEVEDNNTEGISQAGWYYWDHYDFCYRPMSSALGKMLLNR